MRVPESSLFFSFGFFGFFGVELGLYLTAPLLTYREFTLHISCSVPIRCSAIETEHKVDSYICILEMNWAQSQRQSRPPSVRGGRE